MDNISSLRIVGFPMPPFVTPLRKDSSIDFTGPLSELLKHALRVSNISYTLIESPEASHGIELSPGNITGIMRILHENKADLALVPYTISPLRVKYLDLSTPFYYATYSTLSGSPRGFIVGMGTLLDVFHYQVWTSLVISMLLLSGIVRILSRIKEQKRNNFLYYLLVFFGSLMGKEFPLQIYVGNKARAIIFLFWLMGSSCLSSAFMAVLLSFLAIREKPDRIDSVEDIVKYPDVKPLVLRDSIVVRSIKNSKSPKLVQLCSQIERHKSENIYSEMFKPDNLEMTSRGFSVMLAEISLLRRSLNLGCVPGSQFYIAQNAYFHAPIAYGMRKGLPYAFKRSLTTILSLFSTTHQLQHFVLQGTIGAAKCLEAAETRENENIRKPLSYKNLKNVFWCLIFGLIFSFLTLIYELLEFS